MTSNDMEKLEAVLSGLAIDSGPGVIASVLRGGVPLLRRGCGLASLDSGLVNSPSTKMRIGSTTKHFCCVLALMLRNEGKLQIDEPIARWLPELPPSQSARTVRQLMNHTGGTRDYLDLSLLSNGLAILPEQAAFDYQCRQQEENFTPGEQFMYNNGGYRMLSLLIERVLDKPLAQVMRERLFEPLSMYDTVLWSTDVQPLPGSATTHLAHPDGNFTKSTFPSVILGEGGVASTLDDMQRWLSHLINPTLWPHSLSDELMTPTTLPNGYVNPYGFGLIHERWRGITVLHHAGGVVGGTCQMLAAPEQDIQVIVMSNRSDISAADIAEKLLVALVAPQLASEDEPADPQSGEALSGDYYCSQSGRHFAIEVRDGKMFLQSFGMPLPLLRDGDAAFKVNLLSVIVLGVAPVRDSRDVVTAINVMEQGRTHYCERIGQAGTEAASVERFYGKWRSDELGADIVVETGEHDTLRIAGLYGRNAFKLLPLRHDLCLLSSLDEHLPLNGTVRLAQGASGSRELILDTSRTRSLRLQERPAHG
ncbi:class A beta-lactamase-related serine hydrolase [Duganella sp. BJB488]|uniref:serine hydrolase domain-containing protein n=1 Tax=unclassified Duganella TaxID=2636909 RepID=UPI000E34A776|nr:MULTISPECIES: serine hydrolase domain-containing protein [unclassified Duganella]RFP17872.1 class A beta-lactamase-related serine hydrolase [Duganella sp. BJB489]RFP17957.1 class A beta-lactamase-related serine hydrolase [Duganella sp. BJB488]RFP37712.1 class A beta-lactamase-related serine hydrolase [Duganella sp. BJB480]